MAPDDPDSASSLTQGDELARRLCALYVAFCNAQLPLASSEVREVFYPGLTEDSFRKGFSRDRQRLAEAGIIIRGTREGDDEAVWQADSASFADVSSLSAEDALMLDVLCARLVEDTSFAYRGELRLALAKIDRAFGQLTATRLAGTTIKSDQNVQTLVGCMAEGVVAKITYTNAKGKRSKRLVAPYGSFGLRGHTYFVCAQATERGVDPSLGIRTFRADRIGRVKRTKTRFEVPEEFLVEDFIRMPFQIGPTIYLATFRGLEDSDPREMADLARHATQSWQEGGHAAWEVKVSSEDAAATWAIAAGVAPTGPSSLVDCWQEKLQAASTMTQLARVPRYEPLGQGDKYVGRGRQDTTAQARELVALASAFSGDGATLTVEGVSARLGVSPARAQHLMELVLSACSGSKYQLPISLSDDSALVLARTRGVEGKALRLTKSEHKALEAAFDELGMASDDPLRTDVLQAFAPVDATAEGAQASIDALLNADCSETLEACSRALLAPASLAFDYQALSQDAPATRRVRPLAIRHENDLWYLDALDPARKALRTYRIDRMHNVRVSADLPEDEPAPTEVPAEREVTLIFGDKELLSVLEWPRISLLGEDDGTVVASIPYYGGKWLARHLAACGGKAKTDDAELTAATNEVAHTALAWI